jgi:hypothetical protein
VQALWRKIVEWNGLTKALGDEDVIGFGDLDEIASRKGSEGPSVDVLRVWLLGVLANESSMMRLLPLER